MCASVCVSLPGPYPDIIIKGDICVTEWFFSQSVPRTARILDRPSSGTSRAAPVFTFHTDLGSARSEPSAAPGANRGARRELTPCPGRWSSGWGRKSHRHPRHSPRTRRAGTQGHGCVCPETRLLSWGSRGDKDPSSPGGCQELQGPVRLSCSKARCSRNGRLTLVVQQDVVGVEVPTEDALLVQRVEGRHHPDGAASYKLLRDADLGRSQRQLVQLCEEPRHFFIEFAATCITKNSGRFTIQTEYTLNQ
ncbi:hypothetical protein EYF80_014964 [Liparis tanakae]|uniref:Uncharacterized protein n=1 Tax=Liparis tanakae TaxID=230148 RepID=A0A4Z2IBZ7_9TELE|nr:hypothetical protein EYF80_014964 [Liparis tanakae]